MKTLLAIDESPFSAAAAREAERRLSAPGNQVRVLHVVGTFVPPAAAVGTQTQLYSYTVTAAQAPDLVQTLVMQPFDAPEVSIHGHQPGIVDLQFGDKVTRSALVSIPSMIQALVDLHKRFQPKTRKPEPCCAHFDSLAGGQPQASDGLAIRDENCSACNTPRVGERDEATRFMARQVESLP